MHGLTCVPSHVVVLWMWPHLEIETSQIEASGAEVCGVGLQQLRPPYEWRRRGVWAHRETAWAEVGRGRRCVCRLRAGAFAGSSSRSWKRRGRVLPCGFLREHGPASTSMLNFVPAKLRDKDVRGLKLLGCGALLWRPWDADREYCKGAWKTSDKRQNGSPLMLLESNKIKSRVWTESRYRLRWF